MDISSLLLKIVAETWKMPGFLASGGEKFNPGPATNLCYSPWAHEESDMTERLRFQFSLSCIGEGNGNPLQCSCLENPRDGRTWWAAVYGVTQSWTWLKRLSIISSSSRCHHENTFFFFMRTQNFKRNLFLILYIEGKNFWHFYFVSSCLLRGIKICLMLAAYFLHLETPNLPAC